jgi:SAM-dependent methyltransferase
MRDTITRHLGEQFGRPHGTLGRLAGQIMSRRASNVQRSCWTVGLLDLAVDARVLELGYGPGLGIEAVLEAAPNGQVVGIDHSSTMRSMATKRNAAAVALGRATLLLGDAEDPPASLGRFDAIFCCNVWQFWNAPETTIGQLIGLLAPTGTLAITQLPRNAEATRTDTDRAALRIEQQMLGQGLVRVERTYLDLEPVPAVCVTGHPR